MGATVVVDAGLARTLIGGQFPAVDPRSVRCWTRGGQHRLGRRRALGVPHPASHAERNGHGDVRLASFDKAVPRAHAELVAAGP